MLPLKKGDNVLAVGVWNWPTAQGLRGLFLGVRVTVNDEILVDESTDVKYMVPTRDIPDESNPTGWTEIAFDDSTWHKGKYLIGYSSYATINTPAGSRQQSPFSVYSRVRFKISDPGSVERFTLSATYDDAVVVWLNGIEIARSGNFLPTIPHWNSELANGGVFPYESITWATYRNIIQKAEQSSDEEYLNMLAAWLLHQHLSLDKALLYAEKTTLLDQGNLSYRATLGNLYLAVGKEQEALKELEFILHSEPLHKSAWKGVFQIALDKKIDATQFYGFIGRLKKVFWSNTTQRKRLETALALFDGNLQIPSTNQPTADSAYIEENKWAILPTPDTFEEVKLPMAQLTLIETKTFEYIPETPPIFNEKWQKVDDGSADGYVDIQKILAPTQRKTAGVFALTYINAQKPIDTILYLRGIFSGMKLWVNSRLLYDSFEAGLTSARIAVPVRLKKGSNQILVKLIGKKELGYSLELIEVVPGSLKSLSYISPYNTPIIVDRVLDLDGYSGYVEVPDSESLDIIGPITIEFWVLIRDVTSEFDRFVVKTWEGDVYPWHVYAITRVGGTRKIGFVITTEDRVQHYIHSETELLQIGEWVHIAGVYDGNNILLYADGQFIDSLPVTGRTATNDIPLSIGMNNLGNREAANALIDEVRIWNIPRTQEEIQATMQTTLSGDEPGLVGYWNFDNGTAIDLSPQRNNGTLHGGATIVESDRKPVPPMDIGTIDGFNAVPVNQKGQFTLTIRGSRFHLAAGTRAASKPITTIEIRLPQEFNSPGARVMGDVMLGETQPIKASSTQVGSALRIQLEEGIIETDVLNINFAATASSTTASNVMFFVKLLAEDGTVTLESQEGLGGIAVISDAPLPAISDVVANPIEGENDVEISWKTPGDVRISGYEILATRLYPDEPEAAKQEVIKVKGRETTTYQHISAHPDSEISYSVRAVATSSLKSDFSESAIARVRRDTTPPEIIAIKARKIVDLETGDSGTKIEWEIKGTQDIARYEIFRARSPVAKEPNPKNMENIAEVGAEVREYIDKIPRAYIYVVDAIDDQGNRARYSMLDEEKRKLKLATPGIEHPVIILSDKNISNGIRMPNAGDGQNEPATVAGRLCRRSRTGSFYFDVDDEYVSGRVSSPPLHDMYVILEYFDEGTDRFGIGYKEKRKEALITRTVVQKSQGTRKWNRMTFHLPNPHFGNALDFLCDFAIGTASDSPLALAKVTVSRNYPPQGKDAHAGMPLRTVSYAMIGLGPIDVTSPEGEINLNKIYTVKGKPVGWFESFPYAEYEQASQNIDLLGIYGSALQDNFYALTYVESPDDLLVKLDDFLVEGLKYNLANLWINNIPAHGIAQLKKGTNKILTKITELPPDVPGIFQPRMTNLKGDAIENIRYMSPYDVLKDGKELKAGIVEGIMPPQGFHVTSSPKGTVELSWHPPSSGDVEGYEIYQVKESGGLRTIATLSEDTTKWESRKWKPWKTMWGFGLRLKHPSLWFGRESFLDIRQKFLVKAVGSSGAESFSPIYQAPPISYQGIFTWLSSHAAIDKSGNVWWGRDDGLWVFDKEKKEWKTATEELSDMSIDGTSGGVPRRYKHRLGIFALVSDAGGHTWVGTFGGLYKFDGKEWKKELDASIGDIEIDSGGNPWVMCNINSGFGDSGPGVIPGLWWSEVKIKRLLNGEWIDVPSPSYQSQSDRGIHPHAFVLDNNNQLWIGTAAGNIYLYDGVDWKTYGTAPQDIQGAQIQALAPDKDRNGVWVIFRYTKGVFFYDGGTWEKHLPDKRCRSIVIDNHGAVWTEDMKYDGETWNNTDGGDRVILDAHGEPWFMTNTNIKKYDGTESFDFPVIRSFPTFMAVDEQNRLWLGSSELEVAVHDGVKMNVYREKDGISGDVTGLVIGKDNAAWVSTKDGVKLFTDGEWVSYTQSDGLSSNNVSAITLDKYGNPWVVMGEHEKLATENKDEAGIARFEKGNWISHKIAKGFEDSQFTNICVDKGDNVWVGTQDRGLLKFDGEEWTEYDTSSGLTSNKIFKMLSDSKGNVYALMDRDIGASPFAARTGTTSFGGSESILDVAILEGDSFKKLDVPWGIREYFWRECAVIDNEDNLWVGLDAKPGNGLYKFDGGTWQTFRPDSSWLNNWIWELAVDKDNNLWTAYQFIDKVTLRESPIQYPSRARILLLILPILAIGTGGAISRRQWKRSAGYIARVTYHSQIAPQPRKLYALVYSLMKSFQEPRIFALLAKQASSDGKEDIAKRISVFSMLIDYLANLGGVLTEASEAFADASSYEWGEEIYTQYQLLLTAYNVKTVSQITVIASNLQTEVEKLKQLAGYILTDSVEAFDMLSKVADTMRKYERVGLPEDQVVYLNNGIAQIEQMQRFVQKQLSMPDRRIFEEITANWRNIVGNTLTELQSTARLNVSLLGKEAPLRDEVTVTLQLTNIGRGHADELIVKLAPSGEYDAIEKEKDIGTLLQGRDAQVEFRLAPNVGDGAADTTDIKEKTQIRVVFQIQYNDQRRAGNTQEFADTLTLRTIAAREFVELSPNPYIVGKPVREGELFFGREDVFQYIRQNLKGEYRDNIIILHGQRRTGKTSILYQLRKLLADEYIPVLIDMQGILDEGTDAFLYSIATQIYRAMRGEANIPRPRISDFKEQPGTHFRDEFLDEIQQYSNGKSLILMFDEFELLAERVSEGKLDGSIFGYLRNLMQHGEGINFIFSGTHKLEEMSSDYWSILFNIALYKEVTFLPREDVEDLIVLPVKDYFDFDPLAIEKIIHTTAGHPHFTQLLCHTLVNHRNSKQSNYITVQDVTDIIDEVAETGQIHIEYIWRESSSDAKIFLVALKDVLNREGIAMLSSIRDVLGEYKVEIDLPLTIESLSNRGVIEVESGHYRFKIDLVRYWVDKNKSMQEVMGNG